MLPALPILGYTHLLHKGLGEALDEQLYKDFLIYSTVPKVNDAQAELAAVHKQISHHANAVGAPELGSGFPGTVKQV